MAEASSSKSRARKALVIGAGPVGALTALCLHRRGWDVEMWDMRDDPRGKEISYVNQRSINLNISNRGLEALRSVDPSLGSSHIIEAQDTVLTLAAEAMMQEAIPMYGRMIHHQGAIERLESQTYDSFTGQAGWSISRPTINQRLVEALSDEIVCRFSTKISRIDFKKRLAYGVGVDEKGKGRRPVHQGIDGKTRGGSCGQAEEDERIAGDGVVKEYKSGNDEDEDGTPFDLLLGCDGTWSKVRQEMMRIERMNFSQNFIKHAYIELHMPADPTRPGGFKMDPNHLHIWPRHAFMLIALPNKDGSFTLTLFAPFADLDTLDSREKARAWLMEHFASAMELAGEEQMLNDFLNNPRGNLVETHVLPTAWSSHAILLGDSSHSMVPFYGQGLNCGLEDVRVLNSYLENHSVPSRTDMPVGQTDPVLAKALAAYSTERDQDLQAICTLAMNNYVEMRSKVLSPLHLIRRKLDHYLSHLLPSRPAGAISLTNPFPTQKVTGWTSLYHLVTFRADVPYSQALAREQWQQQVLDRVILGTGYAGLGLVAWAGLLVGRAIRKRLE